MNTLPNMPQDDRACSRAKCGPSRCVQKWLHVNRLFHKLSTLICYYSYLVPFHWSYLIYFLWKVFPLNPILQSGYTKNSMQMFIPHSVSFFERVNNAHYNSVVVIDAGGAHLGMYRKTHIPDGPGYQEKFYFNPGDTGFKVFQTRFCRLGVAICWDQWWIFLWAFSHFLITQALFDVSTEWLKNESFADM